MTKQRLLIMNVINESEKHLSVDEIYMLAKQEMPSIVLATVYNNLNALTEQNLIRRVSIHGQPSHYDKNVVPHEHIICDQCGEIQDVKVGDLLTDLKKRTGLPVRSYELDLHYICDSCRGKLRTGK